MSTDSSRRDHVQWHVVLICFHVCYVATLISRTYMYYADHYELVHDILHYLPF